ncbi:MAG: class I SAM-dependent methyltransferase, partial [Pseudomonadota bacterium]
NDEGLGLIPTKLDFKKPFHIDFLVKQLNYRAQHLTMELLIKATGLSKNPQQKVLDTTAGVGTDAYLMASAGAKVTMLERHRIMYVLLCDALARLQHKKSIDISLYNQDASKYIENHGSQFDIIYLDPMYMPRQKKVRALKSMEILKALVGPDEDYQALLEVALAQKNKRIVIKRPYDDNPIIKPSYSYAAKDTRFDVYRT